MALQRWFTLLMSQWLVLLPWLLLGVFCSTALLILTPRPWWDGLLPKNRWLQLLYGLALGLLVPVGQLAALPLTRRLLWQTGSSSLAIAFWLSAASIHPLILWQLWRGLPDNHEVMFIYGGLSLLLTVGIAAIFTTQRQQITHVHGELEPFKYPAIARPSSYRVPKNQPEPSPTTSKLNILPTARKFRLIMGWQNMVKEFTEWSLWLLFAAMITAAVQTFVSSGQWLKGDVFGVLGMGLFGAIDSLHNVGFAAQILGDRGIGLGISFLLIAAFFNLPTLVLMLNVFRLKAFAYLSLLLMLSTLLFDFWLNFYVF